MLSFCFCLGQSYGFFLNLVMKKLFSNAKFKFGAGITFLGGLITLAVYLNKQPQMKPEAGVIVNGDTIAHVQADSIKTDSAK